MKYPIGARHRKLAANTKAGQLARAMHEAIYSMVVQDVPWPTATTMVKRVALAPELHVPQCDQMVQVAGKPDYVSTEKLLREVRDFLDFHSFLEVVD